MRSRNLGIDISAFVPPAGRYYAISYNQAQNDSFSSIVQAPNGYFYSISSYGYSSYTYVLVKSDNYGNIISQTILSDSGGKSFSAGILKIDSAGNIYIGGSIYSSSSQPNYEAVIIKMNSSETIQWQKKFCFNVSASPSMGVSSIVIDSNDDVYLSGNGKNGAYSPAYLWAYFTKIDKTNGNALWTKIYYGSNIDFYAGQGAALTSGLVFYGYLYSNPEYSSYRSAMLFRIGYNGTASSIVDMQSSSSNITSSIGGLVKKTGDSFYISGSTRVPGGGDIAGAFFGEYTYGSTAATQFKMWDNLNLPYGNINYNPTYGLYTSNEKRIGKLDSSFNFSWNREFVRTSTADYDTYLRGPYIDSTGSLNIGGYSYIKSNFFSDALLIRLKNDGSTTGTFGTYNYTSASVSGSTYNSGLSVQTNSRTYTDYTFTMSNSSITKSSGSITFSKTNLD